jgi:hypothetical protein
MLIVLAATLFFAVIALAAATIEERHGRAAEEQLDDAIAHCRNLQDQIDRRIGESADYRARYEQCKDRCEKLLEQMAHTDQPLRDASVSRARKGTRG